MGPGRRRVLLAPLLLATSPTSTSTTPRSATAMFASVDFWLGMGVDGLRLDAVPVPVRARGHELREPARDARLPARRCARTSTSKYSDRMLLAEANQWPEDAVAYFGDGDECHMDFHFPLMPRLFMALRMEDRFPIIDILDADAADPRRLPVGDVPAQPRRADARDGHRRRARLHVSRLRRRRRRRASTSASAAGSRRCSATTGRKIELMNALLLLAARHAGHLLRRRDRHGRQHLPRRPQRRAHADAVERRSQRRLLAREPAAALPAGRHRPRVPLRGVNVEAQHAQPELAAVVDAAADRDCASRYQAFGRGTLEFLLPDNRKVLAFVREYEDERILVVANLSRFAQHVELDLRRFEHDPRRAVRPQRVPRGTATARTRSRSARTTSTGSR